AFTEIVNVADSTVTLASSANPSVYGQIITITATVAAKAPGAGTPTGQLTFTVDSTPQAPVALDGSGKATFTTFSFTAGMHSISASYATDGNFKSSTSATLVQTVNKDDTTTATVSGSPSNSVYGQSVTFTTTVTANPPGSGIPTGTVTFFDNGVPLGNATLDVTGTASLTTNQVQGGSQS